MRGNRGDQIVAQTGEMERRMRKSGGESNAALAGRIQQR